MKRFYTIILVVFIGVFLASCDAENREELIEILPEDLITMEILDNYMFRDDVQYVDLRNYSASFQTGWIDGFEQIPFFDYLDYRAFDREGTYEFNADQILDQRELERLFDKEKAIFLYADGCIRSGYLKDVLNHIGYERVYVLGGFYEYEGIHKVDGNGDYSIGDTFFSSYVNNTTNYTYYVYGEFDMARNITFIRIDILDESNKTLRRSDYESAVDYDLQLTILENYIVNDFVNFTELSLELNDIANSRYGEIPNFDWLYFDDLRHLFDTLSIN